MKKILILALLCAAVTGFAAAGGLVFHAGAGYHSSFVGEVPDDLDTGSSQLKTMPLGVGGYAGLGYGFGKKRLSIGGEFAPSWDLSFDPSVSNFGYQIRGFAKFKPLDMFTATGFVGWSGNQFLGADLNDWKDNGSAVIGGRITVLFLYAEYDVVMPWDFSEVMKHEVGLGFAIFK